MQQLLQVIASVESIRSTYGNNKKVAVAAAKLQLALVDTLRESVKLLMPCTAKLTDGLTREEISLLGNGTHKIPAIKAVRDRAQTSLTEAKDLVEDYMEKHFGYRYKPATY